MINDYYSSLAIPFSEDPISRSGLASTPIDTKVPGVQKDSLWHDLAKGLWHSKVLRSFFTATLLSGVALAGLYALTLCVLGILSPAWVVVAIGVAAFVLGFVLPSLVTAKGWQKMWFEINALLFLLKIRTNSNEIIEIKREGKISKIILGVIPNQLNGQGERLVKEKNVGVVLSINELWERDPHGLSIPHTEKKWNELNVAFRKLDVNDHALLTLKQLDETVSVIKAGIDEGKSVYVHCMAGIGRSAMAVAAYLIKEKCMSAEEACALIKKKRKISTINRKIERLKTYQLYCELLKRFQLS
jgi:hypothetical protein